MKLTLMKLDAHTQMVCALERLESTFIIQYMFNFHEFDLFQLSTNLYPFGVAFSRSCFIVKIVAACYGSP